MNNIKNIFIIVALFVSGVVFGEEMGTGMQTQADMNYSQNYTGQMTQMQGMTGDSQSIPTENTGSMQQMTLENTGSTSSVIQPLDPAVIQERFYDLLLDLQLKYDNKGVVNSLKSLSKVLDGYKDINSVYLNDLVKSKIEELDIPEKKTPKVETPQIVSKNLDKVVIVNNQVQGSGVKMSVNTGNQQEISYTAPNGKKYTFKKQGDWYVYETSTKKLSFKYKQELIDYINLYNPKLKTTQELNAPIKSNTIPSIIHITPNGKSQAIQKLSNGYIIKDKNGTKLFDTLEKAKEYLDKNNK